MIVGASIYMIGLIATPAPVLFVFENETRRNLYENGTRQAFDPLWPHSAPQLNPIATVGYDAAIFGAIIAIVGALLPILRRRQRQGKHTATQPGK
jgi:hypothetical protein